MGTNTYTNSLITQEKLGDWIASSISSLIRLSEATDGSQRESLAENAQIISDIIKDSLGLSWVNVGVYSKPVVSFSSKTQPGTFFDVSLKLDTWTLIQESPDQIDILLKTRNTSDLISRVRELLTTSNQLPY